jgi:hypothetical protein
MQAFGMAALTAVAGTALLVLMGCSSESSPPHTESGPKSASDVSHRCAKERYATSATAKSPPPQQVTA